MIQLEVFCDFDGTITDRDVVDFLLENLAGNAWEELEQEWVTGTISARVCMERQIPLIQGGWAAVEKALEEINIDPTFLPFVDWCNNNNIKLHVVSDGLDRVINHILQRTNLKISSIRANRLIESADGKFILEFPHFKEGCLSGNCKCALLEQAPKIFKVVIGDSTSDFCWAKEADLLFAKKKLLAYCQEEGISHIEFADFKSIQEVLQKKLTPTLA